MFLRFIKFVWERFELRVRESWSFGVGGGIRLLVFTVTNFVFLGDC